MDKKGKTKLARRLTTSPHQMVQKARGRPRALESTHSRRRGASNEPLPLEPRGLLLVERHVPSLVGVVGEDLGVRDVEPQRVQPEPGFLLGALDQGVAAEVLELEERVRLRKLIGGAGSGPIRD